ncbi:MAG: FHA domain-containing protein [Verrucomicrobia bacterium]|nr:FHA domain-containing protein [Verrucomicrobiota bacterium]
MKRGIERFLEAAAADTSPAEPRALRRRLKELASLLRSAPPCPKGIPGRLLWREPDGTVAVADVTRPLVVGRGEGCDLRLAARRLSHRHFRVWPEAGSCWIEDLGSTNGTTINGNPLTGRQQLRAGDLIAAGGIEVFFDTVR